MQYFNKTLIIPVLSFLSHTVFVCSFTFIDSQSMMVMMAAAADSPQTGFASMTITITNINHLSLLLSFQFTCCSYIKKKSDTEKKELFQELLFGRFCFFLSVFLRIIRFTDFSLSLSLLFL